MPPLWGQNLYYANPYGVLERNGWFTFDANANYGDGGLKWTLTGSHMGYANADGTLMKNTYTYDANGQYSEQSVGGILVI